MTTFQKQMLTIAAAGALTAVTALPAMAFENEFHGTYTFNTFFSNYNNGGGGNFLPSKDTNLKMNNYLEQRVRLLYVAKASDDLKLVTQFEINNRFGAGKDANGGGGDLDTDGLNIVTKHAYLDFNIGKSFNTKLGLMPYTDGLKGIFIDADIPAVMTTTKLGNYTLGVGFSRYADDYANNGYLIGGRSTNTVNTAGYNGQVGSANKDLFILDNAIQINKDTKVGLSYYFLADYAASAPTYSWSGGSILTTNSLYPSPYGGSPDNPFYGHTAKQRIHLHTFALSGATKVGGIDLSGFAAMQTGDQSGDPSATSGPTNYNRYFHGWAANVAAKTNIGPGTAKTAFLFVSGNNSANRGNYNGWAATSVESYNESGMMILARNTYNSPTSTDAYIRRDLTNLALLTVGYDAKLTEKINLNTNVGMAWAPSSADAPVNLATGNHNGCDYMGTEANVELGYQLYKNLKLQAQAGYLFLGGYYKNMAQRPDKTITDPDNPYTMRLQARYSF